MKRLLSILIIIIGVSPKNPLKAQVSECDFYYNTILKFPYDWYLTTITANYKGNNIRIITKRSDIKRFLLKEGKSAPDEAILSVLKNETPVKLTDSDILRYSVIKPVARLDSIFKTGREFTLKTFFNERGGYSPNAIRNDEEEAYLIDRLSRWCILVFRDDETGLITLENTEKLKEYFNSPRYKEDLKDFKR